MDKKTFKYGQFICKEGEKSESMYRIDKGEVKVVVGYGKKNEVEIGKLGAGKFFGEMGVIDGAKRSATVIAVTDVECVEINRGNFEKFIADNPSQAVKIMQNLSASLRASTKDYVEACKKISKISKKGQANALEELRAYAEVYDKIHGVYEDDEPEIPYYRNDCIL